MTPVNPLVSTTMGLSGVQAYQPTSTGAQFSFKLPESPKHIVPVMGEATGAQQASNINEPTSWGQMLQRVATDYNNAQNIADTKVRDIMVGGNTSIHEAMISMQEATVRFEMLSEIRNKMLSAYQEIMRMQV